MRKLFCFVAVRKGLHQVSCENAFELYIYTVYSVLLHAYLCVLCDRK